MRTRVGLFLVVASILWCAAAFGQCSGGEMVKSVQVHCQCGGVVNSTACAYGNSGCNPFGEFVPCSGCYIGYAIPCTGDSAKQKTALLHRPSGLEGWVGCHGSSDLAQLEEWVRMHPTRGQRQELSAQVGHQQ